MAEGVEIIGIEQRGVRSPYYREVTPDYIFGGVKPGFIEMSIVTTKASAFEKVANNRDVIEHTEELSLKISPMQSKTLITWLLQNVKIYEKTYGEIKISDPDPAKQEMIKKVDELLATL